MAAPSRSRLYLEHDLIGKPASTFPGHALTVGSIANNTGFGLGFLNCRRVDRIAAPDEGTYRGDAAISPQDTKNRAETRCHPHAPLPPTGWTSSWSRKDRVRWCCSAMAGPNY